MSDYYTNSHTPAKITFGRHLLRPLLHYSWKARNNQPDSHLDLSIPSIRSSLIPFLPLNHPLRLFAFSICLPLALILSLSQFSVHLSHTHFLTENTLALCVRDLPRKYFTFLCREDTQLLSFSFPIYHSYLLSIFLLFSHISVEKNALVFL